MSIRASLAALVLAGAALAAPKPFAPEGAAQAVYDTSTPARANALAAFLRSPGFFARLATEPAFRGLPVQAWLASRLKAEPSPDGTRVSLRLSGCDERQALAALRAVARAVAAPPTQDELLKLSLAQQTYARMDYQERAVRFNGGGRRLIRYPDQPKVDPALADIRFNPPALKAAPRRVQP